MKSKDKNDKNDNGVPDYYEHAIFWYMVLHMLSAILLIVGFYIVSVALGLR